ncbi:YveK family protein [Eubacterium multiforme]|uniref:Capsular polysaccharide biosynthesis protein n=1 Tax=Eubacterium multiforme TaxID=83339 RepID=A0ABT9UT83_9FIRM|nr:Wzz/FepE/Etk N-terminal domain-containing protein [Eubacterium multiforme]MDQ0149526.1 capsular polysaccharide biosynthesis protein [Eubacterium multiforme]
MNEENINISEILDALKKRWKIIVGITLAFTIIAGIISFFVISPKYEVTTKLFIGKENKKSQEYNSSDVMMYQKLLTTYAEVAKTDDLIERALNKANINEKVRDVKENLKITPRQDTQILEISYTGKDASEDVAIVQNLTTEFVKEAKKLIPSGNIQVVEKASYPHKPVSPNKKLNILIAFVLGLVVSVGLSLLLEFMDNTFKSKEELEKVLELPVLGTIPELDSEDGVDRRRKYRK